MFSIVFRSWAPTHSGYLRVLSLDSFAAGPHRSEGQVGAREFGKDAEGL